jgi:hypothetical protein
MRVLVYLAHTHNRCGVGRVFLWIFRSIAQSH